MKLALSLLCGMTGGTALANTVDFLPDNTPVGATGKVIMIENKLQLRVDVLAPELFRLRYAIGGKWGESGLNRYGFLKKDYKPVEVEFEQSETAVTFKTSAACLSITLPGGGVTLTRADGTVLTTSAEPPVVAKGYSISFKLADGERIYGLGDTSRENIMRRGGAYEIWVKNVNSYIPIPMAFSSKDWGILMNTTWRNFIDVGKAKPDVMTFSAPQSGADFYIFAGKGMPALLDTYTTLTGRPKLLPIWAYGLTYVCNENVDAFWMMDEALKYRDDQVPCDTIGLEPGWMSKNYDSSTKKEWHPQRFPIPKWAPKGSTTFFGALQRKHFKLSLWLCCDYDLTEYEEWQLKGAVPILPKAAPAAPVLNKDAFEQDEHLEAKKATDDPNDPKDSKAAEPPELPEAWFDHLAKFAQQGASAFKLDGAYQVIEHPKRIYANGMNDEQMHNLYPLMYDRQMSHGYEDVMKKRSMIYSASGYAGIQQFVASWAGDTGGGPKPLASMLNLGLSGHSNHSCDMDICSNEGIHFGFLQTWAQLNNWAYWRQPWYLEDAQYEIFKDYARLRYSLLPYIYTSAWQASQTGIPVMRAMPLVFPEEPSWDSVKDEYMFGDWLLVTAFAKTLRLPPGEWLDYWTGKHLTGPTTVPADFPANRGGCLLVREGAIIPTWPVRQCAERGTSTEIGYIVFPGPKPTKYTLYEDDGTSLAYLNGAFATTGLACDANSFHISKRQGAFKAIPPLRATTVKLHLSAKPADLTIDGKPAQWSWNDGTATVIFSAADKDTTIVWKL